MNYFELYLYILTVVIMIATPGPVMILVASAGLKGGYRKALQTIVGTNFASLILIAISILIIKGLFSVNETVFIMIKLIGCIYITYLGYGILKEILSKKNEQEIGSIHPIDGGFRKGFLVGISNPKDIIFFSSFFPQFTGIHPDINISLTILLIAWIVLDFLTLSLVYLGFNSMSKSQIYPKILGVCGLLLICIGLYGMYTSIVFFKI